MNSHPKLRRRVKGPNATLATLRLMYAVFVLIGSIVSMPTQAQVALADRPLFSTVEVPGNLVLALSVEFPTAVTAAYRTPDYSSPTNYLGYFDPAKCYRYVFNELANGSYFDPVAPADTTHQCTGYWSGNFLNWATMQAIDPFRWALTGGYRAIDTPTATILEKAVAPGSQGNPGNNFPFKRITGGMSRATPFPYDDNGFRMQVLRCGNRMLFTRGSGTNFTNPDACPNATVWNGDVSATGEYTVYSLEVRVKVCANAAQKEANCIQYGNNYKPEGLIQKYASKIRYSAFGYLLDPPDGNNRKLRDGGVLRARMKFVGPTQPVSGSTPIVNVKGAADGQITSAEWSADTGVFIGNPDKDDASASSEPDSVVAKSGVINYLNQFGLTAQAYKWYDPVSELYYASTRYLRNLGNVPEYSDLTKYNGGVSNLANRTTMKDGFPVISNWTDPVLYSCQKNFVLGIGDTNTNQDKDLPGNVTAGYRTDEPVMPQAVAEDTIDVVAATNKVGVLEGMGPRIGATNEYNYHNNNNNSAFIAGMAYLFHTTDIRTDLPDNQSISTYWLDVLEGGEYKGGASGRNQFYLAAKYGGFTVPDKYSYETNTSRLDKSLWSTNGDPQIPIPLIGKGGDDDKNSGPRPDNYFAANQADAMVTGLESAFLAIGNSSGAFTTSFSASLPQVATTGTGSYSTRYDATTWTGEVTASELRFDAAGTPTVVSPLKWTFSERLQKQLADTGWDTDRRVITWNGTLGGGGGVPFRSSGNSRMSDADLALLDPSYTAPGDKASYVNYLRGDKSNEVVDTNGRYRARSKPLGDIVGSRVRPVGAPSFPYSDATNPGYAKFKADNATRRTVVYVGANDGMMHAINGSLTADPNAGKEMFAYVPRALLNGPKNPATPNVDGLASLGNPNFVHHYMVNATPTVYDIDFARTPDAAGVRPAESPISPTPAWRSVLIGGLGKGGRSYYAIDVTDPDAMARNEIDAAGKVLWEFSHPALGYTYGEPIVTKTVKYGWVVIFPSGYNNSDGKGYFLFVNPRTGALLETVTTGSGTPAASAGLAHANAFVLDASDGTADALYAGDLLGNLWRVDLTATTGPYQSLNSTLPPNPVKLAVLTDASTAGNPQPVTSRPAIEVHPATKKRFVMVGTGRLLDDSDIASTQGQTFYAIVDGTNAQFARLPPSALTFPYRRRDLANNANALNGVNFDATTQAGWYEELGVDTGTPAVAANGTNPPVPAIPATGRGWRVTGDATTFSGSVAFGATVPNGNACLPSGNSRVYGRDYAAATTTLRTYIDGRLSPSLFVSLSGNVTDLRYLSVGGKVQLISGTDAGAVGKIEISPLGNITLRRLNWRELQTVD